MNRFSKKQLMSEMNIVPYVDVMLVLLVIFMITAPLLTTGVQVELPKAESKSIESKGKEPLVVSLNKEGKYFLNVAKYPDKPIDRDSLALQVAAEVKRDPLRQVLVKADQSVFYKDVMGAMVILQQAGANSIGLVTDSNIDKGK